MFRALLELFITIVAAMVARALIASVMKGLSNATASTFQPEPQSPPHQKQADQNGRRPTQSAANAGTIGNDLHKDPVCGTYVSEATNFRRQASGQTFYYCSQTCKEKHALVAR